MATTTLPSDAFIPATQEPGPYVAEKVLADKKELEDSIYPLERLPNRNEEFEATFPELPARVASAIEKHKLPPLMIPPLIKFFSQKIQDVGLRPPAYMSGNLNSRLYGRRGPGADNSNIGVDVKDASIFKSYWSPEEITCPTSSSESSPGGSVATPVIVSSTNTNETREMALINTSKVPFLLFPPDVFSGEAAAGCSQDSDTTTGSITELPELDSPSPLNLGIESPSSVLVPAAYDVDAPVTPDEWARSGIAMHTNVPPRSRSWRSASFSQGKKKARELVREIIDMDCGICFDPAMKPTRTKCCGALFCFEHLSDWLDGASSCPSCKSSCSLAVDTLSLASPASPTHKGRKRSQSASPSRSASLTPSPSLPVLPPPMLSPPPSTSPSAVPATTEYVLAPESTSILSMLCTSSNHVLGREVARRLLNLMCLALILLILLS